MEEHIYIEYDVELEGQLDQSFFAVNCISGTVLRHGTEDNRQEEFLDFYEVRRETKEQIVY